MPSGALRASHPAPTPPETLDALEAVLRPGRAITAPMGGLGVTFNRPPAHLKSGPDGDLYVEWIAFLKPSLAHRLPESPLDAVVHVVARADDCCERLR